MKPKKLVYGVGINDADYVVEKRETIVCVDGRRKRRKVWECPYYRAWVSMLRRCYSTEFQERNKTYKDCAVYNEWLTFSNFKNWMGAQDFEGLQLDKDILFEGNKIYSEATCVFISPMVNTFITDGGAVRGEWLIGVNWHKPSGKFRAQCRNPFTNKQENLGYFDCEQETHETWLKRKLELAHKLAENQTDPRVAKALIDRYSKPYTDKALK